MESNVKVNIDAIDRTKGAFASLKTSLGQVEESTKSVRSKLEAMQPVFQNMALFGGAAFAGIVAISSRSIKAYGEVERAQRQLEHAVLDVSKGTAEQVKQVEDITAALEKKAGVDADSLKMGVAQLSTFGLSSGAVVDLTKSLADLTVNQSGLNATSQDYIGSANSIAKALKGQFGILEKSGIRFTEAQQQIILFGTETEKVSALQEGFAQNLRETTDTVGGTDLAAAKSQRTLENLSETLGKSLAPMFEELSQKVVPFVEAVTKWAEENPKLAADVVLVAAGLAGLVTSIGILGLILPPVIAGFGLIAGVFGAITLPILAIVAAVAAVGFGLYLLWKNWDEVTVWIKGAVSSVTAFISEKWNAAMAAISAIVSAVWQSIKDAFWLGADFLIGAVALFLDWLVPGWDVALVAILNKATEIWESIKGYLAGVLDSIAGTFSGWYETIKNGWLVAWTSIKDTFKELWDGIKAIFSEAKDGIIKVMDELTAPIEKVIKLAQKALQLAGKTGAKVKGSIQDIINSAVSRGSSITGKASGGPVTGRTPYIVGEVGPELFVPGASGTIVPNHALAGAGGNITINISGTFMDDRSAAKRLSDQIMSDLRTQLRL